MNDRLPALSRLATFVLLAIGGCSGAEDEVTETARRELGCAVVEAKFLAQEGSRNEDRELWLAEGCGRVRYYTCTQDGLGEDFVCKATGERELPKPALSSY